jgi:hypothetical protein
LAAAELLCPAGEDVEEPLCVTLLRDPVERTLSFLAQVRRDRSDARDMPLEEIYDDPWYFDRFIHNHQTRVLSMTLEEALAPRPEQEILPEFFRTLIPADARPEDRERLEHMIDHMELDDVQTTRVAAELDELGVDVLDALSADKAVRPRSKYWVPDDAEIYLYLDAVFARPSPVDAPRLMTARTHLEELAVVGLTSDYPGFIAELNHTLHVDCSPDARHNVSGTRHRDVSRSFARRIREDNALDAELVDAAYDLVAARTGRRPTVADDAPT